MNDPFPVLMVHNRYRHPGGEDVSFEADVALLRERGHPVILYEISNQRVDAFGRLRLFFRTVWSLESARQITALVRCHHPAIIHLHNTFPLISPSVHYAAARCGVPVVQHLSNYRLLCPNALFMRDARVCEDCLGRRIAWPSVRYACYRGSRPATSAVATMLALHRGLRTWDRRVARFITVSEFARQKFISGGFDPELIAVRPNFVSKDPGIGTGPRDGGLFVGMLQPWKGVDVLLRAWRALPQTIELRIIGAGPEAQTLAGIAAGDERVHFLGALDAANVFAAMRSARFLVFPSIAYETFGRTLIEAFACGTPVIASRLGPAATLVRHGLTGLHFNPGDPEDLAQKIRWALANSDAMERIGIAARREFEAHYTARVAYARLIEIYREAIKAYGEPVHRN